jgi:hypothetical protein
MTNTPFNEIMANILSLMRSADEPKPFLLLVPVVTPALEESARTILA